MTTEWNCKAWLANFWKLTYVAAKKRVIGSLWIQRVSTEDGAHSTFNIHFLPWLSLNYTNLFYHLFTKYRKEGLWLERFSVWKGVFLKKIIITFLAMEKIVFLLFTFQNVSRIYILDSYNINILFIPCLISCLFTTKTIINNEHLLMHTKL